MLLPHTDDCRRAFQLANQEAEREGSAHITTRHLLVGLAFAPGNASSSLSACGISSDDLRSRLADFSTGNESAIRNVVEAAIGEAKRLSHVELDGGHILLALIHDPSGACAQFLRSIEVDVSKLQWKIESRLPQPSFPLDKAIVEFADHPEVRKLQQVIDDAQSSIESFVQKADFETAALHRDRKMQTKRALQSLLEKLWRNSHGYG